MSGLTRLIGDRLDGLGGFDRRVWALSGVVVTGGLMSILSTTSVNVALSALSQELQAPIGQVQWVVTGYLLALATVIPLTGWAAERFGTRRLWLTTGTSFVLASLLCGLAFSAPSLIVFRVVQGLAGGMIMPLGMIILAGAVGPDKVGRAMSIIGVPMLLGPAFGPVLGGLLIEYASWQWVFMINIPVGLVGLALAWRLLPRQGAHATHRLDWLGLVLASPGVALLTFGLSEIPSRGGVAHASVAIPLLTGTMLVGLFVLHARRRENPLIDVRLFASLRLAAATSTTFLLGLALFGSLLVLPLYFQVLRGENALTTGMLLIPQGLASASIMPLMGRLTDRYGGGRVVLVGASVLAVGTLALTQVDAQTSYPLLILVLAIRGFGLGCSMMPAMAAAYAAMRPEDVPRATSGLNVMQRIGGSIGAALLAVILNTQIAAALPGADGQGAASTSSGGTDGSGGAGAGGGGFGPYTEVVAGAFGTTFWWAFWLTLAILPAAFVLARKESAARRVRRPDA